MKTARREIRYFTASIPGPALSAGHSVNVPAVIVGADVAALGIARGLGAAGVPIIMVDNDARLPAMHSRYVQPFKVSALSGPALIDGLLTLRARLIHRPVLFLRTDTQVRTVSRYRERLKEAFQIRLPEHGCLCELMHKEGFQSIAKRHGFPVPRAVIVREERDFSNLGQIDFPAVVKPCDTGFLIRTQAPRAQIVRSREQAAAVCRTVLSKAPEWIVQEWVEGRDSDIYFCLQYRGQGGVTVSSFTGRKLRSWPPQIGSTASCTAAPEHEAELESLTTAFFSRVGFVGMCSMEFKRDRRTGKFLMIEPTIGRTDLQEEVARLNGVDIPLAAYRYELGLPTLAVEKPHQPLVWSYTPFYWRSVFLSRDFRDSRPPGAKRKSACWRFDDPVPLAFFCLEWMRTLLRGHKSVAVPFPVPPFQPGTENWG